MLADGTVLEGLGFGATGQAVGEVCFNTAMTGYQEILTDPSYAGQIITFTFPHIGNVGTNDEDIETVNLAATPGARGVVLHSRDHRAVELPRHAPSRPMAEEPRRDRARRHRHPRAHRVHPREGHAERRDRARAVRPVRSCRAASAKPRPGPASSAWTWPMVTTGQRFTWQRDAVALGRGLRPDARAAEFHVVAIDYGIKRNILRQLAGNRCKVTVVPAQTSAADILALKPDGILLSNGPGDPAATGEYAVPVIRS